MIFYKLALINSFSCSTIILFIWFLTVIQLQWTENWFVSFDTILYRNEVKLPPNVQIEISILKLYQTHKTLNGEKMFLCWTFKYHFIFVDRRQTQRRRKVSIFEKIWIDWFYQWPGYANVRWSSNTKPSCCGGYLHPFILWTICINVRDKTWSIDVVLGPQQMQKSSRGGSEGKFWLN